MDTDVVIVGGGIAGSTLGLVLAREGLEVVVLERQLHYADRVRGENLHPWGVAEARQLGIYDVLLAAGGHLVEEYVNYRDGDDPDAAEAAPISVSHLFDDVPGEVNLAHPAACDALSAAATNEVRGWCAGSGTSRSPLAGRPRCPTGRTVPHGS